MFRIRRIYDDVVPSNREALKQVQEILRSRFAAVPAEEVEQLGEMLRNPFKKRFRTVLFVADNPRRRIVGFALLLHEPLLQFCYLDWLATTTKRSSGGVGGALYERVRTEARALGVHGLFFECLPDDPEACPDPELLKENIARLRFYERFGARPIIGTGYEAPVKPTDTCMPHLVYDSLEDPAPLARAHVLQVVRAILERKYGALCPPEYVEHVVASVTADPVELRPLRYVRPAKVQPLVSPKRDEPVALVVANRHEIHHVRERGYVESPVRIRSILEALEPTGLFETVEPMSTPDRVLVSVHDGALVSYLRETCRGLDEQQLLYPYVFPIRNQARPPKDSSVQAGYYCIDTFTPLSKNAYFAARHAVDCALTAAREILEGRRVAYALVRPPGHHAERTVFGGFCYFNNTALAAQELSHHGKVAILDLDYHHGNGQQDIFYRRADVLTVSIHGHPRFAYPYFSGFEEERGAGAGEGCNLNLPLPEARDGAQYRRTLHRALRRVDTFNPAYLVIALGLDTAKGDPTGTWSLKAPDFERNGLLVGELGLPTLVVQEGGYRTRTLGLNARSFFTGLLAGQRLAGERHRSPAPPLRGLSFRVEPTEADAARIRALVESTGMFHDFEVPVAEELLRERLAKGDASGYFFQLAEWQGRLVGYTCFGPVACTASSWDVYWIVVHPEVHGRGLGRRLLQETERRIREAGGTRVYLETSQRENYEIARAFYEQCGYGLASVLDDFYAPGDSKVTYCRVL